MGRLNDYLEKIFVEAQEISVEDQQKINRYKKHIEWLKTVGDDQANQQERRDFQAKIKAIKEKYMTPEDFSKERDKKIRASQYSHKRQQQKWEEKRSGAEDFFSKMTDKDKAIAVIFSLKNRMQYAQGDRKNKYTQTIEEIREAFGLPKLYALKQTLPSKYIYAFWELSKPKRHAIMPEKLVEILKKYGE